MNEPLDLEPIKARLIAAGYPRPDAGAGERAVRDPSAAAQRARAELREHIIEDAWALIEALEALRAR